MQAISARLTLGEFGVKPKVGDYVLGGVVSGVQLQPFKIISFSS
ncbi:hypothetical protein D1BOALGB6SA_10172 [Olavius sp. associated proteobacterium Delta 1]|nr:hypothetical protein D1BOALGB6SA_10172 [Olavius sp. associated proteobacterium Delta 1]